MCPIQNQVRPGTGLRRGPGRGGWMSRRRALAGLCLTLALLSGLARVARAAVAPLPGPAASSATSSAFNSLAVAAEGRTEADLRWTAPAVPGVAGYAVYQVSPDGESKVLLSELPATATTYIIPGLDSGTTYYFGVTAFGVAAITHASELSGLSSNLAILVAAPLLAAAPGSSAANLSWDPPAVPSVLALQGYDVYRGTSPGGESTVPVSSVSATVTSSTVSGLDSGTEYYFDVAADYQYSGSGSIQGYQYSQGDSVQGFASDEQPVALSATGSSGSSSSPTGGSSTSPTGGSSSSPAGRSSASPTGGTSASPSGAATTTATSSGTVLETQSAQSGPSASTVVSTVTASSTPTGPGAAPRSWFAIQLASGDHALVGVGVLALLAAGLMVSRGLRRRQRQRRPPSHPAPAPAAAVRTEPQQGPPPAVHLRFTGPDTTHAVRIEPRPGPRTTTIRETIKEVQCSHDN